MSDDIVRSTAETGSIVRAGFGETSIEKRGETASTMLAAQAQAAIQARYIMALQRPRNLDTVRVKLLKACDRLGFSQTAFYAVPRAGLKKPGRITGTRGVIEGLSVRFAEAAIRECGNLWTDVRTIYDDDFKRMVRVEVTDLETNAGYSSDVIIEKTIERGADRVGDRVVLGKRTNSAGAEVFIVQSTEEELTVKVGALVSRFYRTQGLRFVPSDILEECERRISEVVAKGDKTDPEGARKAMIDNFAKLGVMPDSIVLYLGHPITESTPAELMELRGLYAALHDGEVTMAAAIAAKTGEVAKGETSTESAGKAKSAAERIKERTQKVADAKAKKDAPPATTATTKDPDDALFGQKAPANANMHQGEPTDGPPPDDKPGREPGDD